MATVAAKNIKAILEAVKMNGERLTMLEHAVATTMGAGESIAIEVNRLSELMQTVGIMERMVDVMSKMQPKSHTKRSTGAKILQEKRRAKAKRAVRKAEAIVKRRDKTIGFKVHRRENAKIQRDVIGD